MCKWGNTKPVNVLIPADLSHTNRARWAVKGIDRCISDLVEGLQAAGVNMRSSCCGHGKGPGSIELANGTSIAIPQRTV
jgi:hypothetical protein